MNKHAGDVEKATETPGRAGCRTSSTSTFATSFCGPRTPCAPVRARVPTMPDELREPMHGIGFHFGDDSPETDASPPAVLALAEHLTGVAITPQLPAGTAFTCGSVEIR
ncbi:DUF6461 domain-containing protein [Streptomyces sp. NPDC014864]|uniref:DUF6461 domain-containing protein n=1 Tax=Streptomyces sp. NPDC014864 TaxID=3364924 RepID=UPI0036F9F6FB